MLPLCIVVAGDPVPAARSRRGGFGPMIRDAAGSVWTAEWLEVDCRDGRPLPPQSAVSGYIVTGSGSSVTERADWMLAASEQLVDLVRVGAPVLGICFGHQLLAQGFGGEVTRNPLGREMGTVTAHVIKDDPLFFGADSLRVNMSHLDSVLRLPEEAQLLAKTPGEPHAAVRFGARAWGVQFHPEFDAVVMSDYIRERREALRNDGIDPDLLTAAVEDTPAGRAVLQRFIDVAILNV
jgi:GMP synthase (glutamine-hydrolysing)